MKSTIFGIDYGNKFSGTTVICYNSQHKVRFIESSKNSDADAFILSEAIHLKPRMIFIDAPLSLPGIYWLGNGFRDHFFRQCDKEIDAISPMFLGGLTARAMRLKAELKSTGCKIIETYPRMLTELLDLRGDYHKKSNLEVEHFADALADRLEISINKKTITSWHHVDALLAFLSGIRYLNKEHKVFGKRKEGQMIV